MSYHKIIVFGSLVIIFRSLVKVLGLLVFESTKIMFEMKMIDPKIMTNDKKT